MNKLLPSRIKTMLSSAFVAVLAATITAPTLAQSTRTQAPAPQATEAKDHANALSAAFREVFRTAAPSVVNIRSIQRIELGRDDIGGPQLPGGSPFSEELFRRFFGPDAPEGLREGPFGQRGTPEPRERRGEGTGIIARPDGYIVTNNHVVDGATTIRVRLDDETEYDATVVGTDPETDLAVLKIDASGLTAARFANSDSLEIGDWVLALGSPLGLRQTMTAGIVSAKGRNLGRALDVTFQDFIQTDCAINPGNSGGPLVNLDGEVVGINTAISSRTGYYMGVGFAIPSNVVSPIMNTLIEGGSVQRGWLGVDIRPLTEMASDYAGFDGTRGVLISDVLRESPAEAAGMKPGDIVTQVNGRQIDDPGQLLNTVAGMTPGQQANLTVFRREVGLREINVTLGNRSTQLASRFGSREVPGRQPSGSDLGMVVQDVTPQLATQFGLEGRDGVIVSRIAVGSIASEAGLQAGDVISMVNETRIANVQEFSHALREADMSKVVRLQVFREGATMFVYLKAQR